MQLTHWQKLNNYLNGLKQIYAWKEDNEVVKNLFALAQKRFLKFYTLFELTVIVRLSRSKPK